MRAACFVVVFIAAAPSAWADAKSDFDSLFGDQEKKVSATFSKADDAAFANTLIETALTIPESKSLQILMCEKAHAYGIKDPAGYAAAEKALDLLAKLTPDKKAEIADKRLKIDQLVYRRAKGPDRIAAAARIAGRLEAAGDAAVSEGDPAYAIKLYKQALPYGRTTGPDRSKEIAGKLKTASLLAAKTNGLQAKLKANPKDSASRQSLFLLYLFDYGNSEQALKLLSDDVDEAFASNARLAAGDIDKVGTQQCLALATWFETNAKQAVTNGGKIRALEGAAKSAGRFLETDEAGGLNKVKAKVLLARVEKEIEKLGATSGTSRSLVLNLGGVKMEFVRIKPGQFVMGEHPVKITQAFYLGKYEVTQAQYLKIMGVNPSEFKGASAPVDSVSHGDARKFMTAANQLKIKTRGQPVTFRLPTEAEWEFACRAKTKTAYHTGSDEASLKKAGWYSENAGGKTHPVGKKTPNAWGLHDMHGNVSEFVWDRGGPYPKEPRVDPKGSAEGYNRVFRGGSWNSPAAQCQSAHRSNENPGKKSPHIGFRCVVTVGVPSSKP